METKKKPNIPTVFIIFGATGDLMTKKIVPALYHLYRKNKLPKMFQVIGVARREFSKEAFASHVREILTSHNDINPDKVEEFLKYFSYHQGMFDNLEDYKTLATSLGRIDGEWNVCSNKLFYLAVPPSNYKTIFEHLATSGLTIPCGPEEGWTRVIVEKPFGHDLATAETLDELLGKLFREEQIYRIDHYLAKEMLQNILAFRFSNNLLEDSWNNKGVEKIEIRLFEDIGVETRGAFYDGLGALRDVGQNHLLQMLALVTMDNPKSFQAEQVRAKRADILSKLGSPNTEEIKSTTFRAQYEGYTKIKGVSPKSQTETYFELVVNLKSARWMNVPIIFQSGKRVGIKRKEIVVTFKHLTPCMCPPGKHVQNKIVFSLEPKEAISIHFWSKKPGLGMEIREDTFDFFYRKDPDIGQYVEEYEKLLLDCIEGNQLLFISTDEVKATWKYIDPIICAWDENKVPLLTYKADSEDITHELHVMKKENTSEQKKEVGIIGLGKMGGNVARQLLEKGWKVVGQTRTSEKTQELAKSGLTPAFTMQELIDNLSAPRIIMLFLPAGELIDDVLFGENGLVHLLSKGDIIIDGGNSFYKDSVARSEKLEARGLRFVDVGTSGGPGGARSGASLMVGGEKELFEYLYPLYSEIAIAQGVQFFEGAGAGHFVKMIHNGIEYGMMQALAEGFEIMKKSSYKLNLKDVAKIYNRGSVIESRLVGWLESAFELHGEELDDVSGTVAHTGEGEWTIKTAKELGLQARVIEDALQFRVDSENNPSYAGKVLSALREQFGGHKAK